jgi:hypothetical protein
MHRAGAQPARLRRGHAGRRAPARLLHVGDGGAQPRQPQPLRHESFAELAALVREVPRGTRIRFNLSTTFHCPFEGVVPEAEAIDWIERVQALDAEMEVSLCDTTGNAAPDQVRRLMRHAIHSWGHRFAYHGHDTYGLGLANMAAAFEAGCRVFDAGSGGIGGCPYAPGATGNTAMETPSGCSSAWGSRRGWIGPGCWTPRTWRPPFPARCRAGGCVACRRQGPWPRREPAEPVQGGGNLPARAPRRS